MWMQIFLPFMRTMIIRQKEEKVYLDKLTIFGINKHKKIKKFQNFKEVKRYAFKDWKITIIFSLRAMFKI